MDERVLTQAQKFALLFEAHAARQLLGHGCHMLAGSHRLDGLFDPLATVWSIGVEKVLKVGLGLTAVSLGAAWPNLKGAGHGLVKMDAKLRAHLHEWSGSAPNSWIRGLIVDVDRDPTWLPLIRVLDTYARSGRFAYLDRLAEMESPPDEPRPMWDEVEQAVLGSRPGLRRRLYSDPPAPVDEFNAVLRELNTSVATTLATWWFTVTRAAAFGAYGSQGKQFMLELEPRMSLPELPPQLLVRVR